MKQFVFGKTEDFQILDQQIPSDYSQEYAFQDQELPSCCSKAFAGIRFKKTDGIYEVFIDPGIETVSDNEDLRCFLQQGVMRFVSMDDIEAFFHSFQYLFDNEEDGRTEDSVTSESEPEDKVIDKTKLQELISDNMKLRNVRPEELAAKLKNKVYGQDTVIDELCRLIVINNQHKTHRILPVALVGPTATGKSETARSLAEAMTDVYGTQYGFIEIAGSEFIGEHTVHRFFGAPPGYIGHGQDTILEPVRKNPKHVIVINEIEKADPQILVGLMEAMDTGYLGMADNSGNIDLNQCIVMFTSNIPINMDVYQNLSEFERAEMCRNAFTKHCGRPEISGKIGNFLVFSPLDESARTDVIIKFIREELDSFDLKLARVDERLMLDFLRHETKYGARGIRALVMNSVGKLLLKQESIADIKNKRVELSGTIENIDLKTV